MAKAMKQQVWLWQRY